MEEEGKARTRRQVLEVATELLERDGARALSTRSVAAAAGIRAASLYELFGDKDGLLAALAVHAFDQYLAENQSLAQMRTRPRSDDPVADMRRGWDSHVEFGLRHPALYLLMYGPDRPGRRPPAADQAQRLLRAFLDDVADAGRLRVPPAVATDLLFAGVTGITLALIADTAAAPDLSTRLRDAVVASLTTDPVDTTRAEAEIAARALALDVAVRRADDATVPLRSTETALLHDWLHQLAGAEPAADRT